MAGGENRTSWTSDGSETSGSLCFFDSVDRFHPVLRFIRPPVQDQRFSLPLVDAFVWVGRETKEKAYLPEGETKRWTVLFDERACRFHGCRRRFPTDARFNAPFETTLSSGT
eukprot:scaffold2683_cov357-Pavlova_lutheri.AAC.2